MMGGHVSSAHMQYINMSNVFTHAINSTVSGPHIKSGDAEMAALVMTALLVLLVLAVCYSQMWKHKDNYHWYTTKNYDSTGTDLFLPAPQMNIKELLKAKKKKVPTISIRRNKKGKRRKKNGGYVLVSQDGDDSVQLMEDSSSDQEIYSKDVHMV